MSENKVGEFKSSVQVFCEVCDVYVSSAALLSTHIKGKKHQQLIKVKEEQEQASRLSLYITGLKCSETSEDEMSSFFSVYGPVKRIYFDKNKGVFAIVEFENEESAAALLATTEPVVFKGKTLKIKKRTFAHSKSHSLSEKPSDLTASNSKKRKKRHSSETVSLLPNEVLNKMNVLPTVSQQMDVLIKELKLTKEDLHLRSLICDILKEVFREFFPSCEVVLFGSSANGLGCKGSDLDITLLINTDSVTWNIDLEGFMKETQNEGTTGKECKRSKDLHSFVVKVMRDLVPGCSNVIPIYSAKCPVIKFTHQTSGISCDLTINNRLGLQNTNLIKCYMELDPRISQLVYTVRAWARVAGLSGGGSGQLTSYALTLMVLYFLQTANPPVIPSLQNVSLWPVKDKKELYVDKQLVDGWECGFYSNVSNLASSLNTKPVEQLLEEFFDYYGSKFDYGNCAVNIRKGENCTIASLESELQEIHAKNHGSQQECAESSDNNTVWKTTLLCVQDPFELTHNLTQNVGITAHRHIIQSMMEGRKLCSTFSLVGQLNESESVKGIVSLLKYHLKASKRHKKGGYSFNVCLSEKPESSFSGIVLSSFSSSKSFFEGICLYLESKLKIKCSVSNGCKEINPDSSFSAMCRAPVNTWTHCRRERRRHKDTSTIISSDTATQNDPHLSEASGFGECSKEKESTADQGSDEDKYEDNPLLVFNLAIDEKASRSNGVECVVKLEHLGGQGLQTFENFYAFFKKQITTAFP